MRHSELSRAGSVFKEMREDTAVRMIAENGTSVKQMPAAAMSAQLNGLALFTVEQIELIRRLRNSGITKAQLAQAFEAMDQLDRELGPVYSLPVTLQAIQQAAFQRHNLFNAQQAVNVVAANNAALTAAMVAAAAQQQGGLPGQAPTSTTPQQPPSAPGTPISTQAPSLPTPPAQQQAQPQPRPMSPKPEPHLAVKRPLEMPGLPPVMTAMDLANISIPNLTNGLMEFPDDGTNYAEEFRDFISLGEQYCCEQIRNFAIKYSIKQQQIATLAGVSQSYVSRFLKGDVYEMSERSRRAIQKWFIMYRRNPAAIAPAVNAVLITNGSPPKKLAMEMSMATPNGDIVFQPKRERFVFRPNHLEILEKYFQMDNYPSQEKRDEISQACNNATISMAGRSLSEKETVTPQIIGNWFANKRKELKKIIREGEKEGFDVSQVPLRPRGRPCRLLSDLATMMGGTDQGSNHSETASTDASMAAVSPNQPPGLNMECSASPQNAGQEVGALDRSAVDANGGMITPEIETNQATTKNVNNNDTPMNGQFINGRAIKMEGGIPTSEAQGDEALSMCVELAAVNQAILSLTGTQPIDVKTAQQLVQVQAAHQLAQQQAQQHAQQQAQQQAATAQQQTQIAQQLAQQQGQTAAAVKSEFPQQMIVKQGLPTTTGIGEES